MSSVAFNLKRKLEWMGTIRYINYAGELKISSLLKEINIKEFTNKWKAWSNREDGVNMDSGRFVLECTEVLKPPRKEDTWG